MTHHRFKTAGPIAEALLDLFGFDAIVSPWRTIYMRSGCEADKALRAHELAHIAQIDRDGACYFWPKIIWDYFVKGYASSPYEIEANEIEARYR